MDRIVIESDNRFWTVARDLFSPTTFSGALLYALLIGGLAWMIGRALQLGIRRILSQPKRFPSDPLAITFLGQLARMGVYIFAFLTYAHLIPSLQKLGTAWLASVSIASVVIGFAAQSTLGNLISGISLLLYRPFNKGDRLQVNAPTGLESGVVESLNLGYTVLRTADHRRILIPNSVMAGQTAVNFSSIGERILATIPIVIAIDADLDRARQAFVELAKQHPKTLEYASCPVSALGGGTVTLSIKVWCADFQDAMDLKSDLLETARKRFKTEGIELR